VGVTVSYSHAARQTTYLRNSLSFVDCRGFAVAITQAALVVWPIHAASIGQRQLTSTSVFRRFWGR